ncbi:beta-lactamase/transpeptidase-like protein [Mycena alexandri]|uniref:Beta-lactamase/transpeptidase-like protein n=1 Tax=Mycena alexandri TaxID=1745969 RepID=A0AAD6T5A0_9AGAR|nr:beta-lactamase/transpeptidase-like protein [Mycena alexandri]
MLCFIRTTILAALAVASSAQDQQPLSSGNSRAEILTPKLEAAIDAILKEFNSPAGVGVAVVQKSSTSGEWTVETAGYGVAKIDGTKVTSDTLFGIGSNSKLFNIVATGLLISNESLAPRISWNTKIASVLPDWGLLDPVASSESTILDVMSHRTGLPRHDFLSHENVQEVIRGLRYLKPSTGFRELYQYNNHMYTLLSALPEVLVGIPFETYVNDFILEPLGMTSTTYYSKLAKESGHFADGLGRDGVNRTQDAFGVGRVRPLPYWAPNDGVPGNANSGDGGVISNAKEMAIWLQALLGEGQHPTENKTVIPAEVIRRVSSGVVVSVPVAQFPEGSPKVYGGGQSRGTYRGFEYIEHGGAVWGFKSMITRIPDQNLGVAVLSNDDPFGGQIAEAVKFRILDEALSLEAVNWTERLKSQVISSIKNSIPTSRPTNPSPSFPISELAGLYRHPGYGTLELCDVSAITPPSESCRQLLNEIPTTLPDVFDSLIPTLVATWRGFDVTHISFAHFEHNMFNTTGLYSVPTRNSSDKPFWVNTISDPGFVAEFASEEKFGFGVRGFWGAGADVESPSGASVKDRAEAWFEKFDVSS